MTADRAGQLGLKVAGDRVALLAKIILTITLFCTSSTSFAVAGILTTLVGGSWYSSLKFKPPSLNPLNPARTGAALTAPKSPTAALGVGLNNHLNGHVSNHHNHLAAGDGGYNATPFASAFVAQTYQVGL